MPFNGLCTVFAKQRVVHEFSQHRAFSHGNPAETLRFNQKVPILLLGQPDPKISSKKVPRANRRALQSRSPEYAEFLGPQHVVDQALDDCSSEKYRLGGPLANPTCSATSSKTNSRLLGLRDGLILLFVPSRRQPLYSRLVDCVNPPVGGNRYGYTLFLFSFTRPSGLCVLFRPRKKVKAVALPEYSAPKHALHNSREVHDPRWAAVNASERGLFTGIQ